MPRFRKRPVEVDARQIDTQDHDGLCELVAWCGGRAIGWNDHVIAIDTLEGTMEGGHGDWIIRGVAGEFYFCKPDIFDATYEPADTEYITLKAADYDATVARSREARG